MSKIQIDLRLVEEGILDEDGIIIGPEDRTILCINGEHLVTVGSTEGLPMDDEILFNFHTGDSLTELEDGILPDGEKVESVEKYWD